MNVFSDGSDLNMDLGINKLYFENILINNILVIGEVTLFNMGLSSNSPIN
jgi:hypothetical protein